MFISLSCHNIFIGLILKDYLKITVNASQGKISMQNTVSDFTFLKIKLTIDNIISYNISKTLAQKEQRDTFQQWFRLNFKEKKNIYE